MALGVVAIIYFARTVLASEVSSWYLTLAKPALNPPGAVFGPVWTTLYALMGVAAFLIWSSSARPARELADRALAEQEKKNIRTALGGSKSFLLFVWTKFHNME